MLKLTKLIWLVIFLACIAYGACVYEKLPEKIAIHFNLSGQPDGWSEKSAFYVLFFSIVGIMNVLFAALSAFISKIPETIINVPWKKYWFATPERKNLVHQKLRLVMAGSGIFMNAIFFLVLHTIFQVGLAKSTGLPLGPGFIGIILGGALIFIGWIFYLVKPPKSA